MNRNITLLAALVAGLLPVAAPAQASPAPPQQPATPAAPSTPTAAPAAPVPPQAYPAKIALISFQQAVIATNEGEQVLAELQKKYEPKKAALETLTNEIDALKKQMQAAPATMTETDRAAKLKVIDTKDKQYQRELDDANTAYSADLEEAYGKVAQKVHVLMGKYLTDNGFTLALDVSNQQTDVTWGLPSADVTEAVVAAYNTSSGIAPPPPPTPSAARPKPSAAPTTPRTTTPKAATPTKPPTQ